MAEDLTQSRTGEPVEGGTAAAEADLRRYDTVEDLLRDKLSEAIGGRRGAVEAALPTLAFALVWSVTQELKTALIAAGSFIVVLLLVRLAQRQDPRFIAYAAAGVGISAFFALRSGKAADAFLPGMVQNGAFLLLMLLTNLARMPLLGFVVGFAEPEAFAKDPMWWRKHQGIVTVAARLGWVFVALAVVRLAIMIPLYLAEQVGALGVAKVVLGWPAYALAVTVMGAILLRGHTPIDPNGTRAATA